MEDYPRGWGPTPSEDLQLTLVTDALRDCCYCGGRSVAIARAQGETVVSCGDCRRRWSYPNVALSDETVLSNYYWHAQPPGSPQP
jgi:hypothetical protein